MAAPFSRPASFRPRRPVPLLATLLLIGVLAATLNCTTAAPAHGSSSLPRRRLLRAQTGASLGAPRSTRALLQNQPPVNATALIPDTQVVPAAPHDPALPANISAAALLPIRRNDLTEQQWSSLVQQLSDTLDATNSAALAWQTQAKTSGGLPDDAPLTQAAGRALFALSRFQPQELQGLIDTGLWDSLTNGTGQAAPRQCVWKPANSFTGVEVPAQCFVDPAAGVQLLRGGQAPASELDLTLLRLGQLSSKCNRATANFTGNLSTCPPGCSFIMHQVTSSQPGASTNYVACQLTQEDITRALGAHFVAACPGSRLESYMSCVVDEEDFMPSAATLSVSSSSSLSPDDITALKRDACNAKPVNGKGLQGQGCTLVPAAPGDKQGSHCVPKAWSNDTVGTLVQILAAGTPTAHNWAWLAGNCGRDLVSRYAYQCSLKHGTNATSCAADANCQWEPETATAAGECVPTQPGLDRALMGGLTPYSRALAAYDVECRRAATQADCVGKTVGTISGGVAGGVSGGLEGEVGRAAPLPPPPAGGSSSAPQGGSAAAVRGLGAVRLAGVAGAAVALLIALL